MAHKFKTSDFNYDLPQSSIAQFPAEPRDHCKLMVLDKKSGNLNHVKFFEILKFLQEGDLLVVNNTSVIPARIFGHKNGFPQVVSDTQAYKQFGNSVIPPVVEEVALKIIDVMASRILDDRSKGFLGQQK